VLNLFAYTGGFSVAALAGDAAQVASVDVSRTALAWAERNVARVAAGNRHRVTCADVLDVLSRLARQGERFELIVVDPPSYSKTRTHRFVAEKDYATLCQACAAVLAPHGVMLCCINHHKVSRAKLRQMVLRGVRAEGRSASRLRDLPVPLDFPAAQDGEPESKSVLLECD
jgi:23S rRNA (cytosine1962-C5)-methyltransferase